MLFNPSPHSLGPVCTVCPQNMAFSPTPLSPQLICHKYPTLGSALPPSVAAALAHSHWEVHHKQLPPRYRLDGRRGGEKGGRRPWEQRESGKVRETLENKGAFLCCRGGCERICQTWPRTTYMARPRCCVLQVQPGSKQRVG